MTNNEISSKLESLYEEAMKLYASKSTIKIEPVLLEAFNKVIEKAESSRAVLTVLITSLFYKLIHPQQDIRCHQANMSGGYSGRSFDSRHITPFLKQKEFPAMAESGWLTRSLEQNLPYNIEYPGKIQPEELKNAFLGIIGAIEEKGFNCKTGLLFIFMKLAELRDKNKIELAKPTNLVIKTLIGYLCQHFNHKYDVDGAARLPVLAIYAIYQCMLNEVKRYEGKRLLDIASHTSADSQSGLVGDINVKDEEDRYFEGVEVKHGIPITNKLVKDAFSKFCVTPIDRYYILSTSGVSQDDSDAIEKEVERIRASHGCQVIVNGIVRSLNYYIRLLNDPCIFIEKYVVLVQEDKALKYEHRVQWNKIVTGQCIKQG